MLAWINLAVLIMASLLFLYYYVLSVSPAALEKLVGPDAYTRCGRYRVIAVIFELITVGCYVLYRFYPLPVPLPEHFLWSYYVSVILAVAILLPALTLMTVGMLHAGEEAVRPKKEHALYGGIYNRIRHPQAAGEVFLWWVIAFLLNSPFLAIFSFTYVPIFLLMCWAEEQDLVLRYGDRYVEYWRRTGAFFPRKS
jgi:protein-S-isoprenylcysteine O-methyltransferase Ste14